MSTLTTLYFIVVSIGVILFWIAAVTISYLAAGAYADDLREQGKRGWFVPRAIGWCVGASIIPAGLLWLMWG